MSETLLCDALKVASSPIRHITAFFVMLHSVTSITNILSDSTDKNRRSNMAGLYRSFQNIKPCYFCFQENVLKSQLKRFPFPKIKIGMALYFGTTYKLADWSAFSVKRVSPSSGRQPNALWRWRARRPHKHGVQGSWSRI